MNIENIISKLSFYIPRYFGTSSNSFKQNENLHNESDFQSHAQGEIPTFSTVMSPTTKAEATFMEHYKNAGGDENKYSFFSELARMESGYNPHIQNKLGAPAYGYFQFMEGKRGSRSWNNISKFAGVDVDTFRNNPELQIQAAHKLADAFLSEFTDKDINKARELGYSDSALVAGAWLGGVGGVRKLLHKGISVDDKKWDPKGKSGTNMKSRMDRFNNYFKDGGVLSFRKGSSNSAAEDMKEMYKERKDIYKRNLYDAYKIPVTGDVTKLSDEIINRVKISHDTDILPTTADGGYLRATNTMYLRNDNPTTRIHEYAHAIGDEVMPTTIKKIKENLSGGWKKSSAESDSYSDDSREIYADTVELRQFLHDKYDIPYNHKFTLEEITKLRESFNGKQYMIQTKQNESGDIIRVFSEYDNGKLVTTDPATLGYKIISTKVLEFPKYSFRSLDNITDAGWLHLLNDLASIKKLPDGVRYAQDGMQFVPPLLRRPGADYNYPLGEYDSDTDHWNSRDPKTGLVLKSVKHPTIYESFKEDKNLGYEWKKGFDGQIYSVAPWEMNINVPSNAKSINIKAPKQKSVKYLTSGFKNAKNVYNHLIGLGASPEEAAGWTGAFIQESGLNHNRVSSKGARGIAQLLGDELKSYKNYLSSKKLPDTWQNQISYIWDKIYNDEHVWTKEYMRLANMENRTPEQEEKFQQMNNSKWGEYSYENYRETTPYEYDPGKISEIFTKTFERPSDFEANYEQRRKYAEDIYKRFNK